MQPVTIEELFAVLYDIHDAYAAYIYLGFTLLLASSALVLTRRLLVGYQ